MKHLLTGGTERENMDGECQNPTCNRTATVTYEGENDNELTVCGPCYWHLVTGRKPTGLGIEPAPGPLPNINPTEPPELEPAPIMGTDDIVRTEDGFELSPALRDELERDIHG